ncbi:hypothetical protein AABB24_038480 [Solanum stoloniferum]|uniref:Uncharacterized protein n=1 Tax=Solanum stoloniferum TaxID=62892 RepID=A0ABD2QXU7_9SOLN
MLWKSSNLTLKWLNLSYFQKCLGPLEEEDSDCSRPSVQNPTLVFILLNWKNSLYLFPSLGFRLNKTPRPNFQSLLKFSMCSHSFFFLIFLLGSHSLPFFHLGSLFFFFVLFEFSIWVIIRFPTHFSKFAILRL